MTLVLDVGSGASLPDADTARRMVDAVKGVDSGKHKIVLKAQLFREAPPNVPLREDIFERLYCWGADAGYQVTASVFDVFSLVYLLNFEIPFVKIACRPSLYWLAGEVPRRVPVWASVAGKNEATCMSANRLLSCVPRYPAAEKDYWQQFSFYEMDAVSDHTAGWDLYHHASPAVLEKHVVLPDTTGPDAGPWAVTPEQLKEIM